MTGTQDADEQSPLLGQPPRAKQTPLPKLQLAAIYAIKLLVPIAGTQILPYLNLMIQELLEKSGTESNKDRVGYYSGLVVRLKSHCYPSLLLILSQHSPRRLMYPNC